MRIRLKGVGKGKIMICEKCGKELADGEVCTCSAENTAAEAPAEEAKQTSLPTGGEVMANAKNAAANIAQNPIVNDIFSTIKRALTSPVKETAANAKRGDILWVFLAIAELLITAVAFTVSLRHLVYVGMKGMLKKAMGSYASSVDISFGKFADGLADIGAGVFKVFGIFLLITVIVFAVAAVLMLVMTMICKKKTSFSCVCNMLATAYIPSAVLMLGALVFGWIYAPVSVILEIASLASFIILAYLGMQKLDKFDNSPFWVYIIYNAVMNIVALLVVSGVLGTILSKLTDALTSSLF